MNEWRRRIKIRCLIALGVALITIVFWPNHRLTERPSSEQALTEEEVRVVLNALDIQITENPVRITTWLQEESIYYILHIKCVFAAQSRGPAFTAKWIAPSNQWNPQEAVASFVAPPSAEGSGVWNALPVREGDQLFIAPRSITGLVSSSRSALVRHESNELTLYISQDGPLQDAIGRSILKRYAQSEGVLPRPGLYMRWRP